MISFLSVYPPYRGGIAKFSDKLYQQLRVREQIQAFSFSRLYPGLFFPGSSQKLDHYDRYYAEELYHSYNPFNWKRTAHKIFSEQPSLFLYSYWHPFFAPGFSRLLSYKQKYYPAIPSVCIVHNIQPHEFFPFGKQLTRKLLEQTNLLILLSVQTEEKFKELNIRASYKRLFHPVYILPKPDESRERIRARYGFKPDDNIVLFFGLIRDYKGLDVFIKALNGIDLATRNLRPVIAGEFYTGKQKYLNQILPEYSRYYTVYDRFVSEQEMTELFTLADLLVLPYRRASQSGVLANAIDLQLPALVSDQPGLTEHIEHNKTGLIFKTDDSTALRTSLIDYFDKQLKPVLSDNLKHVKEQLSWKHFTEDLIQELENRKL